MVLTLDYSELLLLNVMHESLPSEPVISKDVLSLRVNWKTVVVVLFHRLILEKHLLHKVIIGVVLSGKLASENVRELSAQLT